MPLVQNEASRRRDGAALARALRRSAMRDLAALVAHDLSQPLAVILSYATTYSRQPGARAADPGGVAEALEAIAAQAVRATESLRRLKEAVRRQRPARQRVDLDDIVTEAVALFEEDARRRDVHFEQRLSGHLPPVAVDRLQILEVVVDLVENAFDSLAGVGGDRRVEITTSGASPGEVTLTIRDSGIGLPPESADRIFERYFTTRATGLGLGLALSRSIVEAHGGRLEVVTAPESGAAFRMGLPTAEGEEERGV